MKGSAVKKISTLGRDSYAEGVKKGRIARIDEDGLVWVDFPGNLAGARKARLTGAMANQLQSVDILNMPSVILAFEDNDVTRPVIIDVIHDRIEKPASAISIDRNDLDDVRIDGEKVTFDAKKEIVLRCGNSSITLTHAGKVLISGSYLLSRSSGVNKIKGGSVQIN